MTGSFDTEFRPGATLVEVVMVVILLSAAAVTSSFFLDPNWSARRSVSDVTNDTAETLLVARNTAILNQALVRVQRTRQAGRQRLVIREEVGPLRSGKTWIVELGDQARVSGAPSEIQFAPTGSANRDLTWKINQGTATGQVQVAPASGQVTRSLP